MATSLPNPAHHASPQRQAICITRISQDGFALARYEVPDSPEFRSTGRVFPSPDAFSRRSPSARGATTITYSLTQAAQLSFSVVVTQPGALHGGRCVKASKGALAAYFAYSIALDSRITVTLI
jgi:hypothetical protein